jgi:hypothetical protein
MCDCTVDQLEATIIMYCVIQKPRSGPMYRLMPVIPATQESEIWMEDDYSREAQAKKLGRHCLSK